MIRGDVKVMSDILDDKVLYKSADELPTYHESVFQERSILLIEIIGEMSCFQVEAAMTYHLNF